MEYLLGDEQLGAVDVQWAVPASFVGVLALETLLVAYSW
jgi:hypothetical protein